jgi:MFS family permease
LTVFKAAPTAFVGVIGAGLVNGGVFALFPIYAQRVGLGAAGLAEIMAATQITSLVLQWPLGRLSDHRDRRQVILGLMLTGAVTGLILAWLTDFAPPWALIVAAGAWGAASFTFYGICVAHAVDQLESQDITKVGATLLFLFSIGQMLGPLIGGAAMGVGAAGLFIYAGVTHLLLAVFVAVRIRMQARQSYEEGFEALTTTTPQLAYLDPRYEGVEEEDDFDPERDVRATD